MAGPSSLAYFLNKDPLEQNVQQFNQQTQRDAEALRDAMIVRDRNAYIRQEQEKANAFNPFNAILGGIAGFFTGGPVGAVVGAASGAMRKGPTTPEGLIGSAIGGMSLGGSSKSVLGNVFGGDSQSNIPSAQNALSPMAQLSQSTPQSTSITQNQEVPSTPLRTLFQPESSTIANMVENKFTSQPQQSLRDVFTPQVQQQAEPLQQPIQNQPVIPQTQQVQTVNQDNQQSPLSNAFSSPDKMKKLAFLSQGILNPDKVPESMAAIADIDEKRDALNLKNKELESKKAAEEAKIAFEKKKVEDQLALNKESLALRKEQGEATLAVQKEGKQLQKQALELNKQKEEFDKRMKLEDLSLKKKDLNLKQQQNGGGVERGFEQLKPAEKNVVVGMLATKSNIEKFADLTDKLPQKALVAENILSKAEFTRNLAGKEVVAYYGAMKQLKANISQNYGGNKGVLSDRDIADVESYLNAIPLSPENRIGQMRNVENLINARLSAYRATYGIKSSSLPDVNLVGRMKRTNQSASKKAADFLKSRGL